MTFSCSTASRRNASRREPKTWTRVGWNQVEKHPPELPEVRTGGEAPRRDEYEVPPLPQERGARSHEQRVDVGLPVDHLGDGRRTGVVLCRS